MSEDPKNFSRLAQDLLTRSISEQIRAAQRAYDLAARFGRGELSTQAIYDETIRFASQETSRYAGDLTMLSLNYYNSWLALSQNYSNRFFDAFGAKPEPTEREVVTKEAAVLRRVEVELHAPTGQEAVRSFVLENKRGGTAEISFVISDFTGPDGTTSVRLPLQIEPAHFSLAPGQEITVTLRLPLQAGLIATGQRLRGTIYVQGYENLELGLTVWADAPISYEAKPDASAQPAAASGSKRSSRKAVKEIKGD